MDRCEVRSYGYALLLIAGGLFASFARAESSPLEHFVVAEGDRLVVENKPMRFVSFNIPNLHNVEDEFGFDGKSPWRWPNRFEVTDALESVRQMGGTVVRIYALSVFRQGTDFTDHVHVEAPGKFNEDAFRCLDLILQVANEKGIRVIIPFVDNWHWWGGIEQYAAFRDKPKEAFWTDDEIRADLKETIRYVITRRNTLTGQRYLDDKAIFGWETGNELDSPESWTRDIARTIKQLDPNHLVIDGRSLHGVAPWSLECSDIDVVTTHHYPNSDVDMPLAIRTAIGKTAGKKPYFVGEFGFVSYEKIKEILADVERSHAAGALLWSLRFHRRDGGFYWHSEPAGMGTFKAYHWPGFASGESYRERAVLKLMTEFAHRIRGLSEIPRVILQPPRLLPVSHPGRISWQGAAGADRYDVQRATSSEGPFATIGREISDAAVAYRPLFCDEKAEPGKPFFYRVIAGNPEGHSKPSNVVGPVVATTQMKVDEFEDQSQIHKCSDNLVFLKDDARRAEEDMHRVSLVKGQSIEYRVPGKLRKVRLFVFEKGEQELQFEVAGLNQQFEPQSTVTATSFKRASGDYGYLVPTIYHWACGSDSNFCSLRIQFPATNSSNGESCQLSRIELEYEPNP